MTGIMSLSDSDIRQELLIRGYSVGPVTPSTRTVYRKKLESVLKFENQQKISQEEEAYNIKENYQNGVSESHFTNIVHQQVVDQVEFAATPERVHVCDHSPPKLSSGSSPIAYRRHYEPFEDTLRRRPLYTPGGSTIKHTSSILATNETASHSKEKIACDISHSNKKTKSGAWPRIIAVIICVLLLLFFLIYFHMDSNTAVELPSAE